MKETPKPIKRQLRKLAATAHEEELRRALLPLATSFEHWKKGQVTSGELTDLVHDFHQGPARDLFVRYNSKPIEAAVAYAIVSGVLDRASIPADVMDRLAQLIAFYEDAGKEP